MICRQLLDETPDDQLWIVLIDFVHGYLAAFDDREYDQAFLRLPKGLRMAYHVLEIRSEVSNGGFYQFFFNSTGVFAQETLEALRAFGAIDRADVLRRAIELYEQDVGRPATYRERWRGEMCNLPELDELTRRYWQIEDGPLPGLKAYIQEHIEEFLFPT